MCARPGSNANAYYVASSSARQVGSAQHHGNSTSLIFVPAKHVPTSPDRHYRAEIAGRVHGRTVPKGLVRELVVWRQSELWTSVVITFHTPYY